MQGLSTEVASAIPEIDSCLFLGLSWSANSQKDIQLDDAYVVMFPRSGNTNNDLYGNTNSKIHVSMNVKLILKEISLNLQTVMFSLSRVSIFNFGVILKLIFRFCFVHLPVMNFKCGMLLLVLVGGIGYCKYTKHTHAHARTRTHAHAQASTRKHARTLSHNASKLKRIRS